MVKDVLKSQILMSLYQICLVLCFYGSVFRFLLILWFCKCFFFADSGLTAVQPRSQDPSKQQCV